MPPLRHRALARLAFAAALAAGLSLPSALSLAAQEPAKRLDVRCIVTPPPRIDGLIDDACWQAVAPVSGFYQYDPVNGAKASEETFVWAAFDQDHLYFAFLMKDSRPDKIWAELTPRNEWDENDAIELILDAYNDKRTSITFAVNPRGVQKNSVETIWKSEAVVRPDGWSAEMAIPFKSLRFSAAEARHLGRQLRALHPPPQRDGLLDGRRPRPAAPPAVGRALRPDRPAARLQPRVLPLRRRPDVQTGGRNRHQGRRGPRRQVGHQAQSLSRRHGQPGFQRGRIRSLHPPAVPLRELPQREPPLLHRGQPVLLSGRRGRVPRRRASACSTPGASPTRSSRPRSRARPADSGSASSGPSTK